MMSPYSRDEIGCGAAMPAGRSLVPTAVHSLRCQSPEHAGPAIGGNIWQGGPSRLCCGGQKQRHVRCAGSTDFQEAMGRLGQQWKQNMGTQLPVTGDVGDRLPVSSMASAVGPQVGADLFGQRLL